jgi:hypothetical protein
MLAAADVGSIAVASSRRCVSPDPPNDGLTLRRNDATDRHGVLT